MCNQYILPWLDAKSTNVDIYLPFQISFLIREERKGMYVFHHVSQTIYFLKNAYVSYVDVVIIISAQNQKLSFFIQNFKRLQTQYQSPCLTRFLQKYDTAHFLHRAIAASKLKQVTSNYSLFHDNNFYINKPFFPPCYDIFSRFCNYYILYILHCPQQLQ